MTFDAAKLGPVTETEPLPTAATASDAPAALPATLDEFLAMAIPFVWGILTQHILIGLMVSLLGWWGFRKLKAGKASSWVLHMAYWHLPQGFTGLKATPPSHLRVMVG